MPASLFKQIPRGLFGPLGDRHAELYWDLLIGLYECEFERPPFVVLRQSALEIAEHVVLASPMWADRRQELTEVEADLEAEQATPADVAADPGAVLRAVARRLVARLERSGWLHLQFRKGLGEIMCFQPHAARILDTLIKVARNEQPALQGYVHSIAALLEPKSIAQRPGIALSEAARCTVDLARELKILERNIHGFIEKIVEEASSAAAVLEAGLEQYERAIMGNYHRLKTVDNVYRQRSAILERLEAIERDPSFVELASEWYAAQPGAEPAHERVSRDLTLIRTQFDEIPRIVSEIDERNARFSGVALRKIRYLLRQDRRVEGQLQFIVEQLARSDAPEPTFDIHRCELLSDGFLYTAPRDRPKPKPRTLRARAKSDDPRLRADAAAKLRRLYSRARLEEVVAALLRNRASADMAEIPMQQDPDYVRALFIASFGLDGGSSFRFEQDRTHQVSRPPYSHPAGRLIRRASQLGEK